MADLSALNLFPHLQVFDKDGNGSISMEEFKAGLGGADFGPNGEAMTEFVFRWVQQIRSSSECHEMSAC